MAKTREDFELETGLADDIDGVISDAFFEAPTDEYAEIAGADAKKTPGLTLIIESPDLENPISQWYSCGAARQWQIGRGGREVSSAVKPDSHRFVMNSRAGIVVARLFTLVGGGDRSKGQDFFVGRDHYMTEGDFYIGLNCHWKREPMKTVGGETRDVLMPDRFMGEVSPGKKAPRVAVAEAPAGDLDKILIDEVVSGKTEKEVKMAMVKDDRFTDAYKREVISGTKLVDLEKAGKIAKDPDEKFI